MFQPTQNDTPDLLEVLDPQGGRARRSLDKPTQVIGRSSQADVKLADPSVSRRHAELVRAAFHQWKLRDLGSHNGTFVNGERVEDAVVQPGDEIGIGAFTLRLVPAESEAPEGAGGAEMTMPAVATQDDAGELSSFREVAPSHIATEHLSRLSSFGRELIGEEDDDERLRMLCRLLLGEEFQGRCASALRLRRGEEPERAEMLCEPLHAEGAPAEPPHLSRTLLRAVMAEDQAMMAKQGGGEGADSVELSIAVDVMPAAVLACPLRRDEQTMDVLYATVPDACASGVWLALVVLAVRQYEQAELAWAGRKQGEALAAIERELDKARQIQMRFVPEASFRVEGLDTAILFEPCRWVGGDYADILPMPDGRVLLVVADVCGKGMQAALTTASLHTMIHAGVRAGEPPSRTLQRLNEHLVETLPDASFVTLACLAIDPSSGELECINAGHPPVMDIAPGGELRHLHNSANLPLGIAPQELEAHRDRVDAGHWVALYSDGLTELADEQGQMLGIDGLGRHLIEAAGESQAADGLTRTLTDRANRIRGDRHADDDWTLLVARRP